MGDADVALAREFVERYNARDVEGMASICDPEVETRAIYAGLEVGGVFRTLDGFPRAYFREIDQAWDFMQLIEPSYEDFGDVVLISCTIWGRGRLSGAELRQRIYVVWKMRAERLWLERTLDNEQQAHELAEEWATPGSDPSTPSPSNGR